MDEEWTTPDVDELPFAENIDDDDLLEELEYDDWEVEL